MVVAEIRRALGKPDYLRRKYIALTRALTTVRIVDKRDALLCEPILGAILRV